MKKFLSFFKLTEKKKTTKNMTKDFNFFFYVVCAEIVFVSLLILLGVNFEQRNFCWERKGKKWEVRLVKNS